MVAIVGGGPAGCYAGYLLAKKGKNVTIIEEHKKIGQPVQCTGIVTSSVNDIIKPKKEFILNKITRARIFSKKNFVEVKLKNPNLILDRGKFDTHLANMAKKQGVKIILNSKYIGNAGNKVYTTKKVFDTNYIIGADGPLSAVAKINNMFGKRKFWHGIQVRAKLKNDNIVEFYPNIGTIAWVVPENKETVRIGVMAKPPASKIFQKFLKKRLGKGKIIGYQAGLIPIYNPKQEVRKKSIYLVGDAAAQVKATTGGGIVQGLKAAEYAVDSIINNTNYEKSLKKGVGKELKLHLRMRNIMDRFNEKNWSQLIRIFRKKKNKAILENFDRDYPSKFILKLLLQEPKLLMFAGCMLKRKTI